ncbi:MAG: monofunctional biosynthetic peptidoglycan transglycosylase [Bacteroidetes bacterium]|nr:monofunctional biosynthetic peptidoglycan transglycosylase [Rhodothermia bacterium]MCS7154210.1 monofunctional biosynthetic peptidoglycan transglycosylase [Bacteroidota bacterium]MCX7906754.1 monofunctional biosynthetic peptidoglycan transglycosylase [Bacteroidota bacterium]MDW8136966.1 monofunctional biosynthetic peptidoglycan transglycosylase [Bacteroidota bacterium]MDW8285163.1 monofunctional biosynthetic peptidoglycan transglycosylase [Bacteroidota bacterium]
MTPVWGRLWRRALGLLALGTPLIVLSGMASLTVLEPAETALMAQRRCEARLKGRTDYRIRYTFLPLSAMSRHLPRAAIAGEDGRFYAHWGIDWEALREAYERNVRRGRIVRGGSTITQQLVKNLYLWPDRSYVRKALELLLAPTLEVFLSKNRILELYLNIVEMGDGLFGVEQGARRYYGISAARVSREQAARLIAILPAPHRRNPHRMHQLSALILHRMAQRGW